jgi:hypothetical protein
MELKKYKMYQFDIRARPELEVLYLSHEIQGIAHGEESLISPILPFVRAHHTTGIENSLRAIS